MNRSTTRTLATHVGSLPRPHDLLATLLGKEEGRAVDEEALDARVQEAVTEVVGLQRDRGIDVVNDGEVGKTSFLAYVNDRLGGFEPITDSAGNPWGESREARDFPEYYARIHEAAPSYHSARSPGVHRADHVRRPHSRCRRISTILESCPEGLAAPKEAFMPAIAAGFFAHANGTVGNQYYKTDEEFLYAIGEAMREEYLAIVDAGFLLQIDDPGLLTQYAMHADWSVDDTRACGAHAR